MILGPVLLIFGSRDEGEIFGETDAQFYILVQSVAQKFLYIAVAKFLLFSQSISALGGGVDSQLMLTFSIF